MVDVQVYFHGQAGQTQRLPSVPRPGDYLDHDGKLFAVSAVVYAPAVQVYVVQVSDTLAVELRERWATWGEPDANPSPK